MRSKRWPIRWDRLLTWQQASSDRSLRYLLVMCHGSVKERALSALRDLGFSTVSFRGMTGTAKENDKALAENLAALEKERQEIEQRIAGLGGKREALLEASDRAAIALRREEAKSRLVGTDKVFLLVGWLPADRCAALEKALMPFTCAIETRGADRGRVPAGAAAQKQQADAAAQYGHGDVFAPGLWHA